MGFSFALGTLIVIPLALKKWKVSCMATFCLTMTGLFQLWGGFNSNETMTWILAFPISLSDIVAYTMLMTIFSNTGTESTQGWVMGIFGATVAISFALVGASTNLLPYIGTHGLIMIGGILGVLSGAGMFLYNRRTCET